LINDTQSYKLYDYRIHYPIIGPLDTSIRYIGLIRNNNKKQVIFNDLVIYDFNLKLGDTVKFGLYSNSNLVIHEIDSVQYCNIYHRRYIIDTTFVGIRAFIEGIGFTLGFINPEIDPFESSSNLDCYGERDNQYCNECSRLLSIKSILNKLYIYPNPTNDYLTINSDNQSSKIIHLCITNLSGESMISLDFTNYPIRINIRDLANGIYCVQIQGESNLTKEKIVVLRK